MKLARSMLRVRSTGRYLRDGVALRAEISQEGFGQQCDGLMVRRQLVTAQGSSIKDAGRGYVLCIFNYQPLQPSCLFAKSRCWRVDTSLIPHTALAGISAESR